MADLRDDNFERLYDLIRNVEVAMLTTSDSLGHLRSRPMMTLEVDKNGVMWFFTNSIGGKVDEIYQHEQVNISYSWPRHNRFISVSGHAEIVADRERIKSLWRPFFKDWFPEGAQDPRISLLKVYIDSAEYWDSPANKVLQFIGKTAGFFGNKASFGNFDHAKIDIKNHYAERHSTNPPPDVVL